MDNSNNKRQRFVTAFSVASTLLDASHEPPESSQQLQEVGTIAIPVLEQRTLRSKKEKNQKSNSRGYQETERVFKVGLLAPELCS